jgi:hypothetical protein
MHAKRRGNSRAAVQGASATTTNKKPSLHRKRQRRGIHRRDYARYRDFLRRGLVSFYTKLSRLVDETPQPYTVRDPHTRGNPPANPRDIVRFLLVRAFEGWSYDHVYAVLGAYTGLPGILGFTRVPHPNTVLGNQDRIPERYWEDLIQRLSVRLNKVFPGPINAAGDATGEGTRQFQRWYDVRFGKIGKREQYLKLHALVATRARWPWFLAARVTRGNINDCTELGALLEQLDGGIMLGNLALDKGYQSRRNAELVEARGGRPVMDLRKNSRRRADGSPAWRRMVRLRQDDGRVFRCLYRRRTIVKGVFGAFKRRFGDRVKSRREHR